jgi:hypothetical protein
MSEEYQRIEVITGVARSRQWPTEAKLRIIEDSFEPGETVSSADRLGQQRPEPMQPPRAISVRWSWKRRRMAGFRFRHEAESNRHRLPVEGQRQWDDAICE